MLLLLLLLQDATTPFTEEVAAHFAAWDVDGNGELSKKEVDALMDDATITGKTAAAVAALKLAMRRKTAPLETVSSKLLADYAAAYKSGAASDVPSFDKSFAAARRRIQRAGKEIFGEGAPRLEDVNQGPIGDCYFLAPLGALVFRDPEHVKSMIATNDDGTISVAFGNGKTVKIAAPTDAQLGVSSGSGPGGRWVAVFEEAFGAMRNESRPEDRQADSPTDLIAHGGSVGPATKALTGKDTKRFTIREKGARDSPPSDADVEAKLPKLREALAAAIQEKRLTTCATPKEVGVPGLSPSHAYAIVGFDPEKDAVRLWNPHGNAFRPRGEPGLKSGYDTRDGFFTVPSAEFMRIFVGATSEAP